MLTPDVIERVDALKRFQIMDTAPDPLFDSLARLAADIFGTPVALISFIDDRRQWFKTRVGFDRAETGIDEGLCIRTIEGGDVLVVPDASKDRRFAEDPFIKDTGFRFYAGASLTTTDGYNLGALCVLDFVPRQPKPMHVAMLRSLAGLVMGLLQAHRSEINFVADKDRVRGLADRPARIIGSVQDITDEQQMLARAVHLANHDPMTGLPNRAHFFQLLDEALASAKPDKTHALLFFDLDHFKDINDAFGYEAGDLVIKKVAARLVHRLCGVRSAVVSRFGGDEFAIFLPSVSADGAAEALIAQIGADVSRDLDVMGRKLKTGISMGIAHSDAGDETAQSLFRKADLALRHAKQSGRSQFVTYTDQLADAIHKDKELLREILEGIERNEFEVYYQPVVELRTGEVAGFEALLRWYHPERGLVTAGLFAHLIDDPRLGQRLSDLVFRQVVDTASAWTRAGHRFGQIAINVSSALLRDPFFPDRLSNVAKAGVAPSSIKLEITEGVLLGRTADKAAKVLKTIREMGFEIALDDFGTGYASLVHLTQFPITQLKIDRSFVQKMSSGDRDRTIVQSMCALAEGLGLTAVAEGIEHRSSELMLRMMGCRYGQGFHYAPALQREEALEFILSQSKLPSQDINNSACL